MNDKLVLLGDHFDTIFVHLHNKAWSASAEKKFSVGVEVKVRASGHATPEAAVDDLYDKVVAMQKSTATLPVR